MKKIYFTVVFSLLIIGITNFSKEVSAKEITNLQWKKSVATGKKLIKFRETVTSPALGKKAWKITLLPRDCGKDKEGDYFWGSTQYNNYYTLGYRGSLC